jgi:hypothetical protein
VSQISFQCELSNMRGGGWLQRVAVKSQGEYVSFVVLKWMADC